MQSPRCHRWIITAFTAVLIIALSRQYCTASQVFFRDDFPDPTLDPVKWTAVSGFPEIDDIGLEEPSTPYSLHLNGDPSGSDVIESQVLDLSGRTGLILEYWYERTGGGETVDPGDDLIFQYWDAASWVELDRQPGDGPAMTSYEQSIVILPPAAAHSQFRLRISNIATPGTYDDWFVDDISITIPDDLAVNPATAFTAFGAYQGPFLPSSAVYTITNISAATPLNFFIEAAVPWVDITPSAGTLPPGLDTIVTVFLNANANALPIGSHLSHITFTNLTSGADQTRDLSLQIGDKNILAYIEYADILEEYPNALAAIDSVSTNYTITELTDYTQLDSMLPGHDVLFIPEQELTSASFLQTIGIAWASTLQNFINTGGVVIHCGWDDHYTLFTGAGLMDITDDYSYSGTVTVSDPANPMAQGLSAAYPTSNATILYVTTETDTVIESDTGLPIVINKKIGMGNAVLIGHDYFQSNIDQDTLLGNAVFNLPMVPDDLLITPYDAFNSSGITGGPFTPAGTSYTLTNTGTVSIVWDIAVNEPWLGITSTSGSLTPANSIVIDVYTTSDANILPPATYTDIITFTNITSGFEQARDAQLIINQLPPNLSVTVNEQLYPQQLLPGQVKTLNAAVTLTNAPGGGTLYWDITEEQNNPAAPSTIDTSVVDIEPRVTAISEYTDLKGAQMEIVSDVLSIENRGGPDAAGYIYTDSHEPAGPPFNWIDISATGTNLNLTDDSYYFPITLPFGFDFYGTSHTQVAVCSNGTIYFEDDFMIFINECIPSSVGVQKFVALYWDDLDPSSAGDVYFEIVGSDPNRVLVVQFEAVAHFGNPSDQITAQAQLFEQGGQILLLYDDPGTEAGSGATVGIQGDAAAGLGYLCNSPALEPELAIRFSREFSWVQAVPRSGVLLPGDSIDLDIIFDSNGLSNLFTAQGLLSINSNDQNSPHQIPVSIDVLPDSLRIDPGEDFEFFGHPGGPFLPSNTSYELTNEGSVNIDWQADGPDWLDISDSNATIKPAGSMTIVLTPNALADTMPQGQYIAELIITNYTTGVIQTPGIILNIHTEPKIWTTPPSLNTTLTQGEIAIRTLTIGNTGDSQLVFLLSSSQTQFTPMQQSPETALNSLGIQSQQNFAVPVNAPYNAILETANWIEFDPEAGTVPIDQVNDVDVIFVGDQPPGFYAGEIILTSNDPFTPQLSLPATMTVEPRDSFTELFDPNINDTANTTLLFQPTGAGSYYELCVTGAEDFPIDPAGGTTLPLNDDDYAAINLSSGHRIDFYGTDYETFYVGSNGYITFVSGDTYYLEGLENHFALPRISALFDDLNPEAGGTISYKQLFDRAVVTFENISEYNSPTTNSFQIQLFFNGKIIITYLDIAADDGLVGLSEGLGIAPYFSESDISEYSRCFNAADFNSDLKVNMFDFAILANCWHNILEPGCDDYNLAPDSDINAGDLAIFIDQWLQ